MTEEQFWKCTLRKLNSLLEKFYDYERSKIPFAEKIEQNNEFDDNMFNTLMKEASKDEQRTRFKHKSTG